IFGYHSGSCQRRRSVREKHPRRSCQRHARATRTCVCRSSRVASSWPARTIHFGVISLLGWNCESCQFLDRPPISWRILPQPPLYTRPPIGRLRGQSPLPAVVGGLLPSYAPCWDRATLCCWAVVTRSLKQNLCQKTSCEESRSSIFD